MICRIKSYQKEKAMRELREEKLQSLKEGGEL